MDSSVNDGIEGLDCASCVPMMAGLGGDGMGTLTNPNAINLLKSNAYQAAKIILGPNTKDEILYAAVDAYAKFVIPRTRRALTIFEIQNDMNFKRIAMIAKKDAMSMGDDMNGSMGRIPYTKLLVVGGIAGAGYWYYKRRKSGGSKRAGFLGFLGFGKSNRKQSMRRSKKTTYRSPLALPPSIRKSLSLGAK